MNFKSGVKDGIPIALGYLSVAFTFGVLCINKGFPVWIPTLISMTNLTGTGQFVGVDLIAAGATLIELCVTMLIINIRYTLMSLSLSQKLHKSVTLPQRFLIAFGNTDEIYAVSMGKYGELKFRYMLGIILCSYCGWVGGTLLGSIGGSFFPPMLLSAFGITLFAMFIAIIVPPAKSSKPIFLVIILSIAISCIFYFTPILKLLSSGWVIIICAIVSTTIIAVIFPVKLEKPNADIPINDSKNKDSSDITDLSDATGEKK